MKRDRLTQLIVDHLGVEPEKVIDGATLEDLGADSLDVVELEMAIEEDFQIEISPPNGASPWNVESTVADLLKLIDEKTN